MASTSTTPAHRFMGVLRRYGSQTKRPLVSLVFAAPLLVIYELGVLTFPEAARNGADVWMRGWLDAVGLGSYSLLPLLTIGLLLAWHHTTRQPWRLPRGVLLGMAGESLAFGALLLVLARVGGSWIEATLAVGDNARLWVAKPAIERLLAQIVEYVGAGIYEEVLFRLLLLPIAIAGLASAISHQRARTATAVFATSLLFAGAHHIGAHGESFETGVFLFRTGAGVFFACLFLKRGFGIAIGAHALYDIIVGMAFR